MTSTGLRDRAAELLPCPFCGAQPVVWNDGEDWIAACVGVATCHAEPGCVLNKTRDEAIRKWNTRAPRALLASPAPAGAEGWVAPDVARKLLAIRDALVHDDDREAWHQLYSIADPKFDHFEPWEALERIAAASPAPLPATPPAEARELVERERQAVVRLFQQSLGRRLGMTEADILNTSFDAIEAALSPAAPEVRG